MSRRDLIRMNDEEIRAFLQEQRTLQVATIDHDGWRMAALDSDVVCVDK